VRLADKVRQDIIKQKLKPVKPVEGAIPNVYRFKYKIYYLHAVCVNYVPSGDLISFGEKNSSP